MNSKNFRPLGQGFDYSCGAACVTAIINHAGKPVTENDVLDIILPEVKNRGENPKDGLSPEVLKFALEHFSMSYEVFSSNGNGNGLKALTKLKAYLDLNYYCIVDVQTTPEYLFKSPDGEYVSTSELPDDPKGYVPLMVPTSSWRAGVPIESYLADKNTRHYSTTHTWIENGHYVVALDYQDFGVRTGIYTMDPGYYEFQEYSIRTGSKMPREMLGFRWHDEKYFVKRWYDSDMGHRMIRNLIIAVEV